MTNSAKWPWLMRTSPTVEYSSVGAFNARETTRPLAVTLQGNFTLRQTPEWPRLDAIAHTLAYDDAITSDRSLWAGQARSVRMPVLVLDSDARAEHFRTGARVAAEAVSTASLRTIAGGVHDALAEILASVLAEFFTSN